MLQAIKNWSRGRPGNEANKVVFLIKSTLQDGSHNLALPQLKGFELATKLHKANYIDIKLCNVCYDRMESARRTVLASASSKKRV